MSRDDGLHYDDDPVDLTEIERTGKPRRKGFMRRFFGMLGVLVSLLFRFPFQLILRWECGNL